MSSKKVPNVAQNQQGHMFGQYSLRVLTPQQAEPAVQLLSRQFQDQQPMCKAFDKVVPVKDKEERLREWTKFFDLKQCLTNGLSVGAFDTANNDELVGVSIVKDLAFNQGYQKLDTKELKITSMYSKIQKQLKTKAEQRYQSIIAPKEPGLVLEFFSIALKKKHSGIFLSRQMRKFHRSLPVFNKYQYFYSFASNFKSVQACKNANYQILATLDIKEFKIDGVKYFENIEEENRYVSIFLRPSVLEKASL